MKRWLFLAHRWLGLFGSLLIVLWFGTGFVMMYVPYPALLEHERLARAAPIDEQAVRVSPAQALAAVQAQTGVEAAMLRLRLLQSGPRAVYAVQSSTGGWHGVDAATGSPLRVDEALVKAVGERFAGVPALSAAPAEPDQWSMQGYLDVHRPLWAARMADGGVHYVSGRTGELLRDTSPTERGWNWVGSVLHWIYPTALRRHADAWEWVVIGLSSYALLTALLGTAVGLLRWRRHDRQRRSPYAGWQRRHHLLGLGCAVFAIGWLLSGLLSMNPASVFGDRSVADGALRAWQGGSLDDPDVRHALDGSLPGAGSPAIEIEWWPSALGRSVGALARVRQDATHVTAWVRSGDEPWTVHRPTGDEALARLKRLPPPLGEAAVLGLERLDDEDLYHYRRFDPAEPVWRIRLADAASTWLQVDAATGTLQSVLDRSGRVQRWLYHGLHSWDFAILLKNRPLWDLLMLPALAAGFAFSVTGVVLAARRVAAMRRRSGAAERRWRDGADPGSPHAEPGESADPSARWPLAR